MSRRGMRSTSAYLTLSAQRQLTAYRLISRHVTTVAGTVRGTYSATFAKHKWTSKPATKHDAVCLHSSHGPLFPPCFRFGILWFTVASLLVTWDAFFIFLRPRTMPGGDLHVFFKPCQNHVCVMACLRS